MEWNLLFFLNSALLGAGLAMDAFSVSLANGLNEPQMKRNKMCAIAGVFTIFQAIMPMLGWIFVHTMVRYFEMLENLIPYIALALLSYIGANMLIEGLKSNDAHSDNMKVGLAALLIQGVATSIDALSVGFTIANYPLAMASVCALIIAAVTFIICMAGLVIGKKFGIRLSNKATVLGGVILIAIGLEIFVTGVL